MGKSANKQMGKSANKQTGGLRYVGDGTVAVVDGQQVPPRDLTGVETERYGGIEALLAVRYAGRPLYEKVEVKDDGS